MSVSCRSTQSPCCLPPGSTAHLMVEEPEVRAVSISHKVTQLVNKRLGIFYLYHFCSKGPLLLYSSGIAEKAKTCLGAKMCSHRGQELRE